MNRLNSRFKQSGYRTCNWGYNSWFRSIDYHAVRLIESVAELDADEEIDEIHFVTHSMGCIITRAAMAKQRPQKMGRWVMLAPPNKGSYVANVCPRIVRSVLTPVGELQAREDSYVNQLPVPRDMDIAIIQATLDYIVAEPLTQLETEKDRIVVPGLHSQMLFRRDVADQSMHFLEHGVFQHAASLS